MGQCTDMVAGRVWALVALNAAPGARGGCVAECAPQDGWQEWLFFKIEQDRVMIQWTDGDEGSWAMFRTLNKAQKQKRKETWAANVDESGVPYWMNQHTGARHCARVGTVRVCVDS